MDVLSVGEQIAVQRLREISREVLRTLPLAPVDSLDRTLAGIAENLLALPADDVTLFAPARERGVFLSLCMFLSAVHDSLQQPRGESAEATAVRIAECAVLLGRYLSTFQYGEDEYYRLALSSGTAPSPARALWFELLLEHPSPRFRNELARAVKAWRL